MAQNFPTAEQFRVLFLQNIETAINQTTPLPDKAWNRILAIIWAVIATVLQKELADNTKQNFALTADRAHLIDPFGVEYDLPIKDEVSAIENATLPATTGVIIPAGTDFVGGLNGLLYFNPEPVTSVASVATLALTCRTPGVIGNIQAGDTPNTLEMSRTIANAEKVATVTSIDTLGTDAEETEDYRQRILDIERSPGGGGNSADFRNWAQMHDGVVRNYPYSGRPFDDPIASAPPHRTNYIETTEALFTDGIPDASFLAAVKLTIITNATTDIHNQPLGLTNDTLHSEPIRRTEFYTLITGATFVSGTEADVKADIAAALVSYYLSVDPFVQGLDIDADRNDNITGTSVSEIVQGVLSANSASAQKVEFGTTPGVALVAGYTLGQGEKGKSGGETYV